MAMLLPNSKGLVLVVPLVPAGEAQTNVEEIEDQEPLLAPLLAPSEIA
jgi:hypothetical protein